MITTGIGQIHIGLFSNCAQQSDRTILTKMVYSLIALYVKIPLLDYLNAFKTAIVIKTAIIIINNDIALSILPEIIF